MQVRTFLLTFAASLIVAGASIAAAEPPPPPGWQNDQGRNTHKDNGQQNRGPQAGPQNGPAPQGHRDQDNRGPGFQGDRGPGFQGDRGPGFQGDRGPGFQGDRGKHDRYWRPNFNNRGFLNRDRIFSELRRHNYNRFDGQPYWFHDRYVVRTFDRWGRPVFVEINPYTGEFLGVVRF